MSAISWQLALIDGLFLCLAAGIGLWFRGWLKREQRQWDQRLEILEAQYARLERISGRLQTVCRVLELMGREGGAVEREQPASTVQPPPAQTVPSPPISQREANFERAWQMLTEGAEPAEVAQRLDMGVAEMELMQRMLRYRRQG